MGACAFADDLALLAPGRQVLQRMIKVCEDYGLKHNLAFSTDTVPAKSKTKCVLFRGKRKAENPKPVFLNGEALPWVETVEHLGHTLHESMSMDTDVSRAKNRFMARCNDVRDNLYFCHPSQKMKAIQIYCCDGYGSMLWDLSSKSVDSYFKSWNIQARLAWNVPRQTFTYLIEGHLCKDMTSLKNQILSRYPCFVRKLLDSPSKEIRFLVKNVINDQRSITARNITYIQNLTDLDVLNYASWRIKQCLPIKTVPNVDSWRTSLLSIILEARHCKNTMYLNLSMSQAEDMITSLCIS